MLVELGQSMIGPVALWLMQTEDPTPHTSPDRLLSPDNALFAQARTGRLRLPASWLENYQVAIDKFLYPIAALLFAYLAPILAAILGLPVTLLGFNLDGNRPDLGFTFVLIGGFLPIFFLIWLWLRVFEQRPLRTTGMTRPVLRPYLRGLIVGLLLFGSVVIILGLLGFLGIEHPPQSSRFWITIGGVLLVLTAWMIQGAAEELLARGFLLPILGIRWGPPAGVFVSSLFFSVLHLNNPNLSLISLGNLFLFGLFAALYALYEGQLWGAFAVHAVWNWAQGNLFGFEVSGINAPLSILLDLMETGPDWVTGGSFGPEGGIIVTLLLLAAIVVVIVVSWRRDQ